MAVEITPRKSDAVDLAQPAQDQLDALRTQVQHLRRQDETIQFNMRRLDEELRLAGHLQRDFLPKALPRLGKLHTHALFRPAGYVSGDLYDIMRLDEQHVGFFIVDAVGHGMPAALLTMYIKRALVTKEITATGYRILQPHEALAAVNEALIEQRLSPATFATAVYGVINAFTGELSFSCAGHPPPVLLRDGKWQCLGGEGDLLGVFTGSPYRTTKTQLQEADRVLVYTDGVELPFANDPGPDPWRQQFLRRLALPAERLMDQFSAELDRRPAAGELKDDLTVILLDFAAA